MGEVSFLPAQPMAQTGGCHFCEDRYPGSTVHVITKVGGNGLEVRMCDLCVQSLGKQRGEWAGKFNNLAMRRRKTAQRDAKSSKQAENCPLT
jgi:hypothetical protein